jgi:hypothetical protein
MPCLASDRHMINTGSGAIDSGRQTTRWAMMTQLNLSTLAPKSTFSRIQKFFSTMEKIYCSLYVVTRATCVVTVVQAYWDSMSSLELV